MKQFIYMVGTERWTDTEAWGEAWRTAKEYAQQIHSPIYRDVIKNGDRRLEVFYKAGLFNDVRFARYDNIKIW